MLPHTHFLNFNLLFMKNFLDIKCKLKSDCQCRRKAGAFILIKRTSLDPGNAFFMPRREHKKFVSPVFDTLWFTALLQESML